MNKIQMIPELYMLIVDKVLTNMGRNVDRYENRGWKMVESSNRDHSQSEEQKGQPKTSQYQYNLQQPLAP